MFYHSGNMIKYIWFGRYVCVNFVWIYQPDRIKSRASFTYKAVDIAAPLELCSHEKPNLSSVQMEI